MKKIRIFAHVSLDGVISPGGRNEDSGYANGGWTAPYRSAAGAEAVAEAQGKSFDLLLGRRTYDLWSGYWPKIKGGPFAGALNAATKYVATTGRTASAGVRSRTWARTSWRVFAESCQRTALTSSSGAARR